MSTSAWDTAKSMMFNALDHVFNPVGAAYGDVKNVVKDVAPNTTIVKFFSYSAVDISFIVLALLLLFGVLISGNKTTIVDIAKTAVLPP